MTDSIPQQAGQLAVVPQHTYDALVQELTNIAQADPSKWDPEMRGEFRSWAQSRARFALSHLAAPLAVEDSRERCASSDAKDAARYRWLKMTAPPGSPYQIHQNMLAAKRLIEAYEVFCTSWTQWDEHIDAAMAAASSGKEN